MRAVRRMIPEDANHCGIGGISVDKIRLGMIGIGNMGSEHCRLILSGGTPEIELACVADPRADRRAWAQETLPAGTRIYEDGEALIRARECNAVLIATPHALHPPLSEMALRAGLHVLSEKPAGVSTRQLHTVIAAAKETGLTYALMFNQRTNCLYRAMKSLLDSGELGDMKRVTWIITDWYRTQAYYDSGSWRATWAGEGGGVLLNQCPHQLDLLQWLCGMPKSVRAFCREGQWHDIEVEDDVTAYLAYENGASGAFIASTGDLPGTNRLEIDCDRGKLVCEDGQVKLWRLPYSEKTYYRQSKTAYIQTDAKPEILQTDGENQQHTGVLNAFAAHILHGTPLVADGEEGIRALMLSNAMHLSSWTDRPVTLPIDEAEFERLLAEKQRHSRLKHVQDITFTTDHYGTGSAS